MDPPGLKTIFSEALEQPDGPGRATYLDEACRGDAELRAQVEALLRDHHRIGRLLGTAARSIRSSVETAGREPGDPGSGDITRAEGADACAADPALRPGAGSPGVRIGPYELVQAIGEGGMGTVWLAEQTRPVTRLVALKLIKAGMDNRQVLARFEAERQAPALMDHPIEAQPLIIQDYEGTKARAATIPAPCKRHLRDAAGRVVRVYEAWGKPATTDEWKQKLGLADLSADVFARP
jgi:hypothetical protein